MHYGASMVNHPGYSHQLAWSQDMVNHMGHMPSCNADRPVTMSSPDAVFTHFNEIAPEIRAIIWEEHFLASVGDRPRVHFLFEERTRGRYMCTFKECEGKSYRSMEFLERHSEENHMPDPPTWVCPICSPSEQFGREDNFLDHFQQHLGHPATRSASPSPEVSALMERLRSRSDREKERFKTGWAYPWPALKNRHINREAAEAADRVRERLRLEVVNFGGSGFRGNVQTLVSWTRDLIFFNTNASDPRVSKLVTAPWASKVISLAIRVRPQAGDEAEPDALVKIVQSLPNLREIYLVVSYHALVDDGSYADSGPDFGPEHGFGEGGDAPQLRRDLRWGYRFTVGVLARILSRQSSGPIANPQDDFMQDLRPSLITAEEILIPDMAGVGLEALQAHTAEDVNEAVAFFERNWVDCFSKSLNGSGQDVKVKWVL